MARWSGAADNFTPVVVADTTAFTSGGFLALQGGSGTQEIIVTEIYMGGLAGSAAPMSMCLGRDSTVGATLSGGFMAALNKASAALSAPPVVFTTATTKPQRSSTLGHLLELAFNGFGGIVRWLAAPGQEISMLGNTAALGELSLSCSAGTPGAMSAHIIFEPM